MADNFVDAVNDPNDIDHFGAMGGLSALNDGGESVGGLGTLNPLDLASKFMNTSSGMLPARAEVLAKRQALDEALQRVAAQQAYRIPGDPALTGFSRGVTSAPAYSNPWQAGIGGMNEQILEKQKQDISSAGTQAEAAKLGAEYPQKDIENALQFGKLGEGTLLAAAQMGLRGTELKQDANGNWFKVNRINNTVTPLTGSGTGASGGAGGSGNTQGWNMTPFGTRITKDTLADDQARLKAIDTDADFNKAAMDASHQNIVDVLERNPNIDPSAKFNDWGFVPAGMINSVNPLSGIGLEDTKTLQSEMGNLKAAAMKGAKNVRNLNEFNAITASANFGGGDTDTIQAQATALYAMPQLNKAYSQFLHQYRGTYNTLEGADEVWNKVMDDNPFYVRNDKHQISGVNSDVLSPATWDSYIKNAPAIYNQIRSAPKNGGQNAGAVNAPSLQPGQQGGAAMPVAQTAPGQTTPPAAAAGTSPPAATAPVAPAGTTQLQPIQRQEAIVKARNAIAAGKDPIAVKKRLQEYGIDPNMLGQ